MKQKFWRKRIRQWWAQVTTDDVCRRLPISWRHFFGAHCPVDWLVDAVMLSAGEREEQTDTSTRQGERRSTNRAAAVARRVACAPYRLTATLGAHSHTSSTFSFGKREHFAFERLAISTETITTYERLAKLLDLQYRRAHPTYWLLLASIRGVYYVMEKVRRPCNGGLYWICDGGCCGRPSCDSSSWFDNDTLRRNWMRSLAPHAIAAAVNGRPWHTSTRKDDPPRDSDISRTTPARVMAAHVPLSFLLLIAAYKTLPVGLPLIALIPASSAVAITPPASRRVNEILQLWIASSHGFIIGFSSPPCCSVVNAFSCVDRLLQYVTGVLGWQWRLQRCRRLNRPLILSVARPSLLRFVIGFSRHNLFICFNLSLLLLSLDWWICFCCPAVANWLVTVL